MPRRHQILIRTTLSLEEWQRVKRLAAAQHLHAGQFVSQLVRERLAKEARTARV